MIAPVPPPTGVMDVEASCAICGAPPTLDCPHESESLTLAMSQALEQWSGLQMIKDWVLIHARNRVIHNFQELRCARYAQLQAYLHTHPRYDLYRSYNGSPPLSATEIAMLHAHVANGQHAYRLGVDEDWRHCCQQYPEVLGYFFGLVDLKVPDNRDSAVARPVFGAEAAGRRRRTTRMEVVGTEGSRRKERRGSRGHHHAEMPGGAVPGFQFSR